jgi:putative ubiquitin-RnfH superfamily antitoxin RatB of RatAB toxin-antitoxin module
VADYRPIAVEVAYALPQRQQIIALRVPAGCSAFDAARQSGIADMFEEIELDTIAMGIFGHRLENPRTHALSEGDRVELYRPLLIDPKAARRERARGQSKQF